MKVINVDGNMEYLKKILGIEVRYKENEGNPALPNFIRSRYEMERVGLSGIDAVFVYPRGEHEPTDVLKKHLRIIENAYKAKTVLILNRLTFRQRECLLRERIPFVVEGKQIYLPFLAVYLQKRCDGEAPEKQTWAPATQVLLLHYLYGGCGEIRMSEAAKSLGFTPMSISRACKQLEESGLIQTKRKGVDKILFCDKRPKELFLAADPFWLNPVKRTVYVLKKEAGNGLLLGGLSALSGLTSLNPPHVMCYASDSVSKWAKSASPALQDGDGQCAVELWRYDPKRLSKGNSVDPLSLALALRDEKDERVEAAVEEMLERTWREIDGERNRGLREVVSGL